MVPVALVWSRASERAPLQEIADSLDMQLQHARYLEVSVQPFGTWVLWHTLATMCRFLTLGFQLELYSVSEFQMVRHCTAYRTIPYYWVL